MGDVPRWHSSDSASLLNLSLSKLQVMVSPGYMRNYLYERRIAVYSTPTNIQKHFVPRSVGQHISSDVARLSPARISLSLAVIQISSAGSLHPSTEYSSVVDSAETKRHICCPLGWQRYFPRSSL